MVRKGVNGEDGYSGFTIRDPVTLETVQTELPTLLADADVTKLVVAGLATDYCVKSTVLGALERGFPVWLLAGAIRAVNLEEGDGDRALAEVAAVGCVIV